MKLRYTLPFLGLFSIAAISTQAQNWLKSIGGTNADAPYCIAQDASKNVYVGGAFVGTDINFNPGGTAITLTATSAGDNGFFAKYNAGGILQWAIAYPKGTGGTRVNSITSDPSGFIYVAGWMDGSNVDFNPYGTPMLASTSGAQDIFLAKYNSSGICQWVRIMGGPSFSDQANGVAYDPIDGGVILAGQFIATTNFNPAGTAMNRTPAGGVVAGNTDIFFAKYNSSGICQWVRQIGVATLSDNCNAVAVDNSGNIIIGGWSTGSNVNFNPGGTAVTRSVSGTGSDMYVAKYDNTGILQWIVHTGGTNTSDAVNGLTVDATGNVYAAGNFAGTNVNFNPNGTSTTFSGTGTDAYLAKYNSTGVLQWAKPCGGSGTDRGRAVVVSNTTGDVFYGGQFSGTNINFNPGGTAFNLTAANIDPFVICYSSAGVPKWGFSITATSTVDDVKGLALDDTGGKLYVAGQFQSTSANFDPLNSTATTASGIGSNDIFIARYSVSTGLLSLSTLPVSWTKIDAVKNGDKVAVRWETSCEINNNGFAIERSSDGSNFQLVGYMASTADADCGKATYAFEDRVYSVDGKLYYRLKQTDIDGKHSYSKVVMVSNDNSEKVSVQAYPNPANNNFTITRSGNNGPDKAVIYSGSGKMMTRLTLGSYNKVDCSGYAPGIYYINYYNGDKMVKSDKMIISR